ncbi:MAG TPA: hypothetical protein VKA46_37010 [Gemmataceae bacterium]|nr:hypothetical protein [Gemmataceae bacterium]
MFSFVTRLLGRRGQVRRRSRAGRPARTNDRHARPSVESLEDRRVPTIVFSPYFGPETTYPPLTAAPNDGMQNPNVYFIFAGAYWRQAGQAQENSVVASAKRLLSGPYLSGLTQYGSDGRATFAGFWQDDHTVAETTAGDHPEDLVDQFVQNSIASHPGHAPGSNDDAQHAPIYVAVFDPTQGGSTLSWNHWDLNNHQILHIVSLAATFLPHTSVLDNTITATFSHELVETISDPDKNGVHAYPPASLPASLSPGGGQICDGPEAGSYNYRLNGDLVSPYWSRQDNAFIVPDGNSQKFYLSPLWNSSNKFTGKYDLNVNGDQLGKNYNDNIRVDDTYFASGGGYGVKATLNGASATFDPGVIRTLNVNTVGGINNVQVAAVPSGVTANIQSWSINGNTLSSDSIVVGNDNGSLAGIQGTVNVSNTSGRSSVLLNSYSDGPQHITITDHSVAYAGLTTINYTSASSNGLGVTSLELYDSRGANQIDVESVPDPLRTSVFIVGSWQDKLGGPASSNVHLYPWH